MMDRNRFRRLARPVHVAAVDGIDLPARGPARQRLGLQPAELRQMPAAIGVLLALGRFGMANQEDTSGQGIGKGLVDHEGASFDAGASTPGGSTGAAAGARQRASPTSSTAIMQCPT